MESLDKINKKLDLLISRIEILERALELDASPIFSTTLKTVKMETAIASKILKGYASVDEYRRLSRDDISIAILQALSTRGVLNILQLTDEVRRLRGKSSRRIIRKKLVQLAEKDIVVEVDKKKGREFALKEKGI